MDELNQERHRRMEGGNKIFILKHQEGHIHRFTSLRTRVVET